MLWFRNNTSSPEAAQSSVETLICVEHIVQFRELNVFWTL